MRPGDLVWALSTWDITNEPIHRLAVFLCERYGHVKVLVDGSTQWVPSDLVDELKLKDLTGNSATVA